MVEQGAAPAVGSRKINSGRLRVTVRPYYEGPPFSGLVRRRRKESESSPIPRWKAHPSVAESYGPEEPKIAAVERRQAARSPLMSVVAARRNLRRNASRQSASLT